MNVVAIRGQDPVVNAALQAREAARLQIQRELASLKQETDEAKASKRLVSTIDAMNPKQKDAGAYIAGVRLVADRLNAMKLQSKTLKSYQYRNARIILMYGAGKLPRDQLEQVCAILKLRGPKGSIELVCEAFPGFTDVFNNS